MHNNLRITRILKSLGELGFEHYQAPLVRFFLEETLVKKTLSSVKRSVLDYFLFAVLDKQNRQELLRFAYNHFEPKDKFVWCPRKIQKQFKKPDKRSEAVWNGVGKDDVCSRGKSKDEEAVAQQKEEELDNGGKAEKENDKTSKDKNKVSEASPEAKPETVAVDITEAESTNEVLGNGHDSTDDDDDNDEEEMDQTPEPETVMTKTEPSVDSELKFTNNSKDATQEPDTIMQTDDRDMDTEKPPKKKREDNKVLPSNGSAGDSATGQTEGKAGTNKATGQMSPSAQTPHKISKHSPSHSLGKEEKIPRTDCSQVPDNKVEEEPSQAATNGSLMAAAKGVDEQRNRKKSEDADVESKPSSSHQNS